MSFFELLLEVTSSSAACVAAIDAYYDAVLAYKPFPAWSKAADEAILLGSAR